MTIVKLNGFKYFKTDHGTARAITHDGKMIYARDYPVTKVTRVDDIPREPDDAEFIEMLDGKQ